MRRQYGVWSSLIRLRRHDLLTAEYIFALVLAAAMGTLLAKYGTPAQRTSVTGDYLSIAAALVGVVFAGFALVIGLMSDHYVQWLQRLDTGVEGFLRPFIISIGLQVTTLVGTVVYRAFSDHLPRRIEEACFALLTLLFLEAACDVVALGRSVLMSGITRSKMVALDDLEEKRKLRAGER